MKTSTSIPTFLLSGRFDPLDPPKWADKFGETLERGTAIRVPWAGHSTLRYLGWSEGRCGYATFTSFIEMGHPDMSCVEAQPAVDLGQHQNETANMIENWFAGD